MAEWYFKHLVADQADGFLLGSAGVGAMDGYPPSAETLRVLEEQGIDASEHRSRKITSAMVRTADKIFVMEVMHKDAILQHWPEAAEKTHLLTEYSTDEFQRSLEIDIPDPIRMPNNFYNNVFQVIRDCVERIAEEMGVKLKEEDL
jgi:protein-tyrosine-phosphatase